MFMTFFVLNFFRSSEVSDAQPENMKPMSVTFFVLKCFRSSEVSSLQ